MADSSEVGAGGNADVAFGEVAVILLAGVGQEEGSDSVDLGSGIVSRAGRDDGRLEMDKGENVGCNAERSLCRVGNCATLSSEGSQEDGEVGDIDARLQDVGALGRSPLVVGDRPRDGVVARIRKATGIIVVGCLVEVLQGAGRGRLAVQSLVGVRADQLSQCVDVVDEGVDSVKVQSGASLHRGGVGHVDVIGAASGTHAPLNNANRREKSQHGRFNQN